MNKKGLNICTVSSCRSDNIHCKKRLAVFLSTARMSLTKLSLAGNNQIFLSQGEIVNDILAGDWKTAKHFYSVGNALPISPSPPYLVPTTSFSDKCLMTTSTLLSSFSRFNNAQGL
jgi:hypothetical protein